MRGDENVPKEKDIVSMWLRTKSGRVEGINLNVNSNSNSCEWGQIMW